MVYDGTKPGGSDTVGSSDDRIRENFRALKDDKIVNAGKLNEYAQGNAAGQLAINNSTVCSTLNADMVDGYHAGNAAGQVPVNNDTLNVDLDADKLDGQHGSYYLDAGNINAGALDVVRGGTGLNSFAKGDVLVATGTAAFTKVSAISNGQVLMSDSSEAAGVKFGNLESSVVFGFDEPDDNENSHSIKLPRAFTAVSLDLLADIAPTSSVLVQIYRNGSLWTSNYISGTSTQKTLNSALSAGDVLYAKISGFSYGLDKLTVQIGVNG